MVIKKQTNASTPIAFFFFLEIFILYEKEFLIEIFEYVVFIVILKMLKIFIRLWCELILVFYKNI